LKAFTTGVPSGRSSVRSSGDEVPGAVASRSQVWVSTGFVMSTTTLPASRVGVLLNGVLDPRVVHGEDDDLAAERRSRVDRSRGLAELAGELL
jgi:hypothetical protein